MSSSNRDGCMSDIEEDWLRHMTWRELLDLQAEIHEAIRARIREKSRRAAAALASRSSAPLPQVEARSRQSHAVRVRLGSAAAVAVTRTAPSEQVSQSSEEARGGGLEKERDAWLARKRATTS